MRAWASRCSLASQLHVPRDVGQLHRNLTLTVAAVITSSVSLLLFGLTLLIQHGFDNQLQQWSGGVELIVYVETTRRPRRSTWCAASSRARPTSSIVSKLRYCDVECSLAEAHRLFAGDPDTLQLLNVDNIPSQFKVVPDRGDQRRRC